MQALITQIFQTLVNHPEEIRVDLGTHEGLPLYEVHTHPEDIGQALGKEGRIINAIRTVVRCAAVKDTGSIAFVEVVDSRSDPKGPEPQPSARFRSPR